MNVTAKILRKQILSASYQAQAGHIPSAFSIIEILLTLYKKILIPEEDIFILSKGHGCLALYAVFAEMGIIDEEELYTFSLYNSRLGGHPHSKKIKEIYASTGSLGHGLPIALGAALARKIQKKNGKIYCLVGDGECNEGTIWETALLAEKLKLDNLVCIIDNNNSQVRSLPTTNLKDKFACFGWETNTIDGHNFSSIEKALKQKTKKPLCIIANTIKGKGIKDMEQDIFAWHHGPPNTEQYQKFYKELDAKNIC